MPKKPKILSLAGRFLRERRLPVFWQSALARHAGKFNERLAKLFIFSKIRGTPAVTVAHDSDTEVHTLCGHANVDLYLVAIKSFLRFKPPVAVVLHDDGSLQEADKKLLQAHIVGIRIVSPDEAKQVLEPTLQARPCCQQYRALVPIAAQVFDYVALAKRERIISLDADTIFLRRPDEIMQWLEQNLWGCLFNSESKVEGTDEATSQGLRVTGLLNGGLVCFHRRMIDFDLVERDLARLKPAGYHWTTVQLLLDSCLCSVDGYRFEPLSRDDYAIYFGQTIRWPSVKFLHFIAWLRFAQTSYCWAARHIIVELKRARASARLA